MSLKTRPYQNVKGDLLWHLLWFVIPFQKTQDKGATPSRPRTTCQNSSTCCILAQPDSPSSWTDCERVRMFLTTLLMSLVGRTFCHLDGNISKSSGKWHAWTKQADVAWSCWLFWSPRRVFQAAASHYSTSEILWFLYELMLAVLQGS